MDMWMKMNPYYSLSNCQFHGMHSPHLLPWQADSLPLSHQGSPKEGQGSGRHGELRLGKQKPRCLFLPQFHGLILFPFIKVQKPFSPSSPRPMPLSGFLFMQIPKKTDSQPAAAKNECNSNIRSRCLPHHLAASIDPGVHLSQERDLSPLITGKRGGERAGGSDCMGRVITSQLEGKPWQGRTDPWKLCCCHGSCWYLCSGSSCCCSVTQLCPTLCDLMDYSLPGFPVLHYL